MDISISIIIPTHDRCSLLLCVLEALSNQTADPKSYEVIVVADGCQDNTVAAVKKFPASYRLTLIEQASSGPARARNQGAKEASAPLLMFLDDDIEPAPNLIESHLEANKRQPDGIILGYFPFIPDLKENDLLSIGNKLWWSQLFSNQMKRDYRFTFLDFITANLSIPRHLFAEVGGFDEDFSAATTEDSELGLRLLKRRLSFNIIRESISIHNGRRSEGNYFKRKVAEGYSHILFVKKHPEVLPSLPLVYIIDEQSYHKLHSPKILFQLPWSYPIFAKMLVSGMRVLLILTRLINIKKWYYPFLEWISSYYYWCGVRKVIGSFSALQNLIRDSQAEIDNFKEIGIDIKNDLKHLDSMLLANPIDAARLRYGDKTIGRINPIAGAESLRVPHIHESLIGCFSLELLKAINPEISEINYDQDAIKVYAPHAIVLLPKLLNAYRERLILLEPGWHLAENWDGIPIRWMKERAELLYYSETECYANLKFQTFSFYRPRTLEIYVNDTLISRQDVPKEFIAIIVQVHINEGINIIQFIVPEGCERPCNHREFDKTDTRCLSLATKCIELMPISE
jgi:glycosyltransferase involved in cell wall biosynthesis